MKTVILFSLLISLTKLQSVHGAHGGLPPLVARAHRYCGAVVIPGYEFTKGKKIPWFCSGGIVSRSHVVTSAICVKDIPLAEITVVAALESPWYSIDQDRYHAADVRAEQVEPGLEAYAIAVVKLHRQMIYQPHQMPLGLATTNEIKKNSFREGQMHGIGYGIDLTDRQGFQAEITALPLQAIEYKDCDDLYPDLRKFKNHNLRFQCVGYKTRNANGTLRRMARNDVGGPIVGKSNMKLYGISCSWHLPKGKSANDPFPTISISLQDDKVRNTILKFIKNLGESIL